MSAAVLKQNIEAMHRTQQSPSFVQVLFVFELALADLLSKEAEIKRLREFLRGIIDNSEYDAHQIARVALGDAPSQ